MKTKTKPRWSSGYLRKTGPVLFDYRAKNPINAAKNLLARYLRGKEEITHGATAVGISVKDLERNIQYVVHFNVKSGKFLFTSPNIDAVIVLSKTNFNGPIRRIPKRKRK